MKVGFNQGLRARESEYKSKMKTEEMITLKCTINISVISQGLLLHYISNLLLN